MAFVAVWNIFLTQKLAWHLCKIAISLHIIHMYRILIEQVSFVMFSFRVVTTEMPFHSTSMRFLFET